MDAPDPAKLAVKSLIAMIRPRLDAVEALLERGGRPTTQGIVDLAEQLAHVCEFEQRIEDDMRVPDALPPEPGP